MKRSSIAALAGLALLPAAVIVSTAISTSAPSAPATATTLARLTDTGDSGTLSAIGSATDCHTIGAAGINPDTGQLASITISGGGGPPQSAQATTHIVSGTFTGLKPSTTYTITMTAGSDQYPFTVTTPAC